MISHNAADQLKRAIDALGLDAELEELVSRGITKMPAPVAEKLLAGLVETVARIPEILEAGDRVVEPMVVEDAARVESAEFRYQRVFLKRRAPRFIQAIGAAMRDPWPIFSLGETDDIAIDVGATNTLIYARGRGIVLDEPSVVSVRQADGPSGKRTIQAVGKEAIQMLGKVPGNIESIRPMKDGLMADFTVTEQMIKQFIGRVHPRSMFAPSPRIIICVPCDSTRLERRAIKEAAHGAGASQVYLIEEPMAAAIGAGLPVSEATGSMVVDIGGGKTEVGVISLGGIVYTGSVRVGGDKFDEAIVNYIRRNYGMLIGEQTAEAIKKEIGSAFRNSEVKEMEVKGRNLSEGIPRSFTISSNEILEALTDPLNQIVSAVKIALRLIPPELSRDIAEHGIMLTGGGALLRGLDRLLAEETSLPVLVAKDPMTCVVRGSSIALARMELLGQIFTYE